MMKSFDANLILGRPGTHGSGVLALNDILAEMDRCDIERGLITQLAGSVHNIEFGNAALLREMRAGQHEGDRLITVPVVDLDRPEGGLDWEAWTELGTRGVRCCPSFFAPSDNVKAIEQLLQRLSELGWFLQVPLHPFCKAAWQTGTIGKAVTLAKMQLDVRVMILCPGRNDFAELCRALEACPNIYVDVGNLTTGTAVNNLVAKGFVERLVYGSGFGVCYITPSRDIVRYSPIPEPGKEAILYRNLATLMEPKKAT